jgi:thiol reductant ABC exporter CydC subunit
MERVVNQYSGKRFPFNFRLLTFNPFVRLIRLVLPFWRGMALATVLGVLTIASSVGLMMTSAWLISKSALQPSIAELGVAVVSVRFFGIARGVFRYLERLVSHDTTFRLLAALRVRFYRAIEPLAPARLADYRSGDLLSRVVNDIESLQNVYLRAIAPPLVALLIGAGITLVFAAFDPLVALVALAFMLMAGISAPLLTWWSSRRAGQSHAGRAQVQARADLNAALIDTVQGISEIVVYGRAVDQLAQLEALNRRLSEQEMRLAWLDAVQVGLIVALSSGAALAVLAVAIPRIEPIFLATLALGTVAVFEALMPLSQAAAQLGANVTAAERLFEVIDAPPAVIEPENPAEAPQKFDLWLSDVTFRYSAEAAPVLEHLTLDIPEGKRIAIVGASGSGKSTLVNLLARFWEVEAGQILLDGRDLRDYKQTDVRSVIGVMEQRTHLFNTTIRENIWIGRREASEDEVIEAAKSANIHDFIVSLPEGYATLVGENGVKLSGGERQRVALARVLLKNAPILVLDEPTANLDAVNERAILETILGQTRGRTLTLLTHRRVLLDRMDEVVVMEKGKLKVES